MIFKVGCDLVNIKRFKRSLDRGERSFLSKIFCPQELIGNPSVETLAGIFAAKEAVTKALELKAGHWQKIEISKTAQGRPQIKISGAPEFLDSDISISHDGEYAIALACFIKKD